jgi:bacillithiol system protein YtxJ
MNLFSTIFGSSESNNTSKSKINWIPLTDLGQLDEIVALSNEKLVVILKHSTRCSISRFALKQFEAETFHCNVFTENNVSMCFLDLLEHRDISNAIASRFGVFHQSPQLLLIKKGKSDYDVSHCDIVARELNGKI